MKSLFNKIIKAFSVLTFIFLVNLSIFSTCLATSGCCSWHGGVDYCDTKTGRQVCNDGTYSPSCTCDKEEPPKPKISSYETKESEPILFETQQIDDNNLDIGKEEIRQEGENGIKEIIYKITTQDGKQISKEKVKEEITKQATPKIIARGTKQNVQDKSGSNIGTIFLFALGALGFGILIARSKKKNEKKKQRKI